MDAHLQTHIIDLLESEMQTEQVETKNERIQTPYPELTEAEVQTEEVVSPILMIAIYIYV
jgi:hypothetical protein